MISLSQTRYGSRVPCQGRSWRPCSTCHRTRAWAKAPSVSAGRRSAGTGARAGDGVRAGCASAGGIGAALRPRGGVVARDADALGLPLEFAQLPLHVLQGILQLPDAFLERTLRVANAQDRFGALLELLALFADLHLEGRQQRTDPGLGVALGGREDRARFYDDGVEEPLDERPLVAREEGERAEVVAVGALEAVDLRHVGVQGKAHRRRQAPAHLFGKEALHADDHLLDLGHADAGLVQQL